MGAPCITPWIQDTIIPQYLVQGDWRWGHYGWGDEGVTHGLVYCTVLNTQLDYVSGNHRCSILKRGRWGTVSGSGNNRCSEFSVFMSFKKVKGHKSLHYFFFLLVRMSFHNQLSNHPM